MIKINLLDFNDELRKVQIQKQAVSAASMLVLGFVFMGMMWALAQRDNTALNGQIAELDSQIGNLESRYRVVKKMQKKTKRTHQIITGIEDIRNHQTQPAMILDDINQLIPDKIWLKRVKVMTKRDVKKSGIHFDFEGGADEVIEIKGMAIQTQAVTEYVERLKKISYFKTVYLPSIERRKVGINPVWLFYIYCHRV